jgi:hypothetical protein
MRSKARLSDWMDFWNQIKQLERNLKTYIVGKEFYAVVFTPKHELERRQIKVTSLDIGEGVVHYEVPLHQGKVDFKGTLAIGSFLEYAEPTF